MIHRVYSCIYWCIYSVSAKLSRCVQQRRKTGASGLRMVALRIKHRIGVASETVCSETCRETCRKTCRKTCRETQARISGHLCGQLAYLFIVGFWDTALKGCCGVQGFSNIDIDIHWHSLIEAYCNRAGQSMPKHRKWMAWISTRWRSAVGEEMWSVLPFCSLSSYIILVHITSYYTIFILSTHFYTLLFLFESAWELPLAGSVCEARCYSPIYVFCGWWEDSIDCTQCCLRLEDPIWV